ncbi:ABC transporter transmembrane domain-containing protein, partial [Synechococcus sp. MU1650]|uniref:ABC transporter transmembrane domain-containing protein n=1 Tax=Synechococcus sp. MU1650 TaxID=2508352 RepID=UPI001CF8569C
MLSEDEINILFDSSSVKNYVTGQRLYDKDRLPSDVSFILSGKFRLIVNDRITNSNKTLAKYGPGRLIGWSSVLRGAANDYSICSEEGQVLSFKSQTFLDLCLSNKQFGSFFDSKLTDQELFYALDAAFNSQKEVNRNILSDLDSFRPRAVLKTISSNSLVNVAARSSAYSITLPQLSDQYNWYLSSGFLGDKNLPWTRLNSNQCLSFDSQPRVPLRLIGLEQSMLKSVNNFTSNDLGSEKIEVFSAEQSSHEDFSLEGLGIVEEDTRTIEDIFPYFTGNTPSQQVLAICQMLSAYHNVPFRKDAIQKVLDDYLKRDKEYSLQMIGGLLELVGYRCLIGQTNIKNIGSLDFPAIIFNDQDLPILLFGKSKANIVIADPAKKRLSAVSPDKVLDSSHREEITFLIPQKSSSTLGNKLTWSWFLPLVDKYKKSLALVFAASLLAQLFGLGIPLLIQQIIDKVLAQGNLNSLNLIGSAMIVMALFQGLLTALRTYIFVDTTDRMDLTLGSTVIQKLLSLPLGYFDKRPVGELSQRLGELNTIRGFLTGTALVSSLNIIFALIYLVVMFLYSPTLSLIALSTIPLYIGLVFVSSPIFKSFIRKRAIAQAKTQSHLIEVLNGIQTVKAQHFELTARWKWQDKYRLFVDQGFKSSVLGVTTSEIGKFLNTISSLLVLW